MIFGRYVEAGMTNGASATVVPPSAPIGPSGASGGRTGWLFQT